MADTVEERVKKSLIISCFASLSSIIGALFVIYFSRPSLKPWLYGILKSFLAGALTIVMLSDKIDTEHKLYESWAYGLGVALTGVFVEVLMNNPPSGPNKMHPEDATLTEDELRELQIREFDSPRARERALIGGILTAVVIGLRNLSYGVWFFSFVNTGRWLLHIPRVFFRFLAPRSLTLGAAVAVPMYFGSKCWWRTLLAVAVSSAAYPLGHYLAAFALPSAGVVLKLFEFSAGPMSVLTQYWMLTSSFENTPWRHCIVAACVGIICMAGIRFGSFPMHYLASNPEPRQRFRF